MTHPRTAIALNNRDLGRLIRSHLIKSKFTPNFGNKFLPMQSFRCLVTRDSIREDLPSASDDLIDFIDSRARRTFATVLLTWRLSRPHITSVMESFQTHDFDDSCLPINEDLGEQLESCLTGCTESHAAALSVFHDWDFREMDSFYANQWKFLAPEFPLHKNSRTLHEHCILPFTEFEKTSKEGTFGEVHRAKLRVDHQKMAQQPQESGPLEVYVAVKRFKEREKIDLPESEIPDPMSAWSNEADKMEELTASDISSGNIAGVLGCFSSNGDYYIIMPWATGGTLREFWDTNPSPKLCGNLIIEFLEQYTNLAKTLCDLHRHRYPEEDEDKTPDEGSKDISFPVPQNHHAQNIVPEAPEVYGDTMSMGSNWRHGDLKPANILRKEDGHALGPLMIGDIGLAKKHKDLTAARKDTDTRLGTMNYEPPEAFVNSRAKSRAYDIWSMGCIIFETIVWLLYGKEGQDQFYNQPCNLKQGTRYYTAQDAFPKRKLNDIFLEWTGHILANDPECSGEHPSSALRDLLTLAKNELLVVNPPNDYDDPAEGERINAEMFRKRLDDILRRSHDDDTYLYTGRRRDEVSIPDFTNQLQTQKVGPELLAAGM